MKRNNCTMKKSIAYSIAVFLLLPIISCETFPGNEELKDILSSIIPIFSAFIASYFSPRMKILSGMSTTVPFILFYVAVAYVDDTARWHLYLDMPTFIILSILYGIIMGIIGSAMGILLSVLLHEKSRRSEQMIGRKGKA